VTSPLLLTTHAPLPPGPRVSVVMSVYNGEKYLREAVDSILGQTFGDFEFIIVDDGSTDSTWAILQSYDDQRVILLRNENNIGLTRSLNRGLAIARGEYIARMDADDISLPERFEKQVKALDENPRLGLVGSDVYYLYDATGHKRLVKLPHTDVEVKWHLLFHNSFAHSAVMFRRGLVEKIGFYDEASPFAQDYELFSRIAEHCQVGNLPQPFVVRRYRKGQIYEMHSEQQMAVAAMVSRRNIQHLLKRAGERYDGSGLENPWALWSTRYPPLIEQSPEQVIDFIKNLFSIFCQQCQPLEHTGVDFQHTIAELRRSTFARLYFCTAIRYYRQEKIATARTCFLRSLLSQPANVRWPFFARLVLRTLVGRRVFEALKRQKRLVDNVKRQLVI
jgi:glycosyltransferase involved in cell wall biosynthesis